MREWLSEVRVAWRAFVGMDAEGLVVRGVWVVRRDVSAGNDVGIGLREERVGRRVDVRSRWFSFGKTRLFFGGEESDVRGLARRERVWRLGSAVSGWMCSRVVMLLDERSNFVRGVVVRGKVMWVR